MKAVMLTSDSCEPCAQMKESFSDLIKSGEVQELNFEKNPDAVMQMMNKYPEDAEIPSILILSNANELIVALKHG